MRRRLAIPLLSLAATLLAALVLLAPVLATTPHLVSPAKIVWMEADPDHRPRRPTELDRPQDLRSTRVLRNGAPLQYTYAVEREAVSSAGSAVLVVGAGSTSRVFVNGLLAEASRSAGAPILVARIEPDALQTGRNYIDILDRGAPGSVRPVAVLVGPASSLAAAAERVSAASLWSLRLTALLGAAGALLGFLAATVDRYRHLAAPSGLALALALAAWLEAGEAGGGVLATWAATSLIEASAFALLVLAASEPKHWRWPTTVAVRAGLAGLVLTVMSLPLALWRPGLGLPITYALAYATTLACAAQALGLIFRSSRLQAIWPVAWATVAALSSTALLAGSLSRVDVLGPGPLLLGQPTKSLLLASASAVWLAWLAFETLGAVERMLRGRLGLGRLVREQQAQLDAQKQALEKEISLRAVLEERERLSRDIHDGVGGSLTALLLRARSGGLKDDDLEQGLQHALGDLRLMIDALDHGPSSIDTAFSTLQTRLSPAFAASGVALDWRQENLADRALGDPKALLQVFRIVQEACTNILRHSGAAAAMVRIAWDDATSALQIEVIDDGIGGNPPEGGGNGLSNIEERAAMIGAQVSAGRREDGPGWRVALSLPIQ